jgi:hypothetical protein
LLFRDHGATREIRSLFTAAVGGKILCREVYKWLNAAAECKAKHTQSGANEKRPRAMIEILDLQLSSDPGPKLFDHSLFTTEDIDT